GGCPVAQRSREVTGQDRVDLVIPPHSHGRLGACHAAETTRGSQARTAAATASRSVLRLWSPCTCTTVRRAPAGGMPKASRAPCTTSVGTVTASSSCRRLGDDPERRGGCSGNARQRTPAAPVA